MTTPLPVSTVRTRISTAITGALTDYKESRHSYEDFPTADSRQIVHQSFATGMLSTAPDDVDVRQRLDKGSMVHTIVGLRVAFRVKADSTVVDTNASLDAEHAVIKATMATPRMGGLTVRFLGVDSRRTIGKTIRISDIRFRFTHRFDLS
tara:strand:+ start:1303 stop:1752 length:450 start_codon:yes stop_codon:yes gene_type:complete